MALFKIFKGSKDTLGSTGTPTATAHEGFAYFTQDDGKFYIDIANGPAVIGTNRIPLNAQHADSTKNIDTAGTWSWKNGTTAGPTATLTIGGKTTNINAIPSASASQSGIVTTAA